MSSIIKLGFLGIFLFITCVSGNAQDNSGYATSISRDLIRPPHLKKGDTIMIVSPAGKINDKSRVDAGIELANHWGLIVFFGDHLLSESNTFAGTDAERLEDLQEALDNPSIKAIWCSRGGYGLVRIVDKLDFTKFMESPKWVIGYSDVTVLHNKLHNLGVESVHAQMPLTLKLQDPVQKESIVTLREALFGKELSYKFDSSEFNRNGKATGQLVGGNLSIVYSMLGSETDLKMDGKILFIEDVNEALYHIDRMLISLKRAGYFENCAGLIVGDFRLKKNEENGSGEFGETVEDIVLRVTEGTNFPVIFNFPAGHIDDNRTLIMGNFVEMEVKDNKSKVTFK